MFSRRSRFRLFKANEIFITWHEENHAKEDSSSEDHYDDNEEFRYSDFENVNCYVIANDGLKIQK